MADYLPDSASRKTRFKSQAWTIVGTACEVARSATSIKPLLISEPSSTRGLLGPKYGAGTALRRGMRVVNS